MLAFFHHESIGGIVMIVATVLALVLANSAFAPSYESFVHSVISVGSVAMPISEGVNDGLMVLFFLLVGLELKRELRVGVLAERRQVVVPLVAALGGMLVPAMIFLLFNHAIPEHRNGWAIPTATDIAFAVCVLSLSVKRVPIALKIFLLAIAIFDDLGAILVIACFYSHGLVLLPLLGGVVAIAILYGLNRAQVTRLWPYLLVGVGLWVALYYGGVHTTIAGVLVGMAVPLQGRAHSVSPLDRLMRLLHPWVQFLVLPLFAFVTAGIALDGVTATQLLSPLPLGIALGLFFGKQIGICAAVWVACCTKRVALPEGMRWRHVYAVSVLAGIGFTMSLFIGNLAFTDVWLQAEVKLGVMGGSLISAIIGAGLLRLQMR